MISNSKNSLKWLSLIILVIQNATTILLLRYVRTVPGDMFFATTAIVCQELIKMLASFVLLFLESSSVAEFKSTINQQILNNRMDSIKTGIPALLFTIQNNLIYLAISNLNAAVFQVTFQIKILTTALFMVTILKRSLRFLQWVSLIILTTGVAIIQIQNVKGTSKTSEDSKNALFGLFCVVMACVLSGLAGVYFEKILKNSKVSIWVRNIQLGMFGTFFALMTTYLSDFDKVMEQGFFFGYTPLVWLNILIQSAGGLLVAVVIKYADNILKGFATSIAIVVSCLASSYFFGTEINSIFAFGTMLVIFSVFLYSYMPAQQTTLPTTTAASSASNSLSSSPKSDSSSLLYFNKGEMETSELIKYKIEVKDNVALDMNGKS